MDWIQNKNVVVPLDMSEFSITALQTAQKIVADLTQIRVVSVLPVLTPSEPGLSWNPTVDDETRIQQTRTALDALLQEYGYEKMDISVRIGDAGVQIALFADDIDAGLIVIPSHGRGMLRRMLLGSTADKVVHHSHCPVLVLKTRKEEQS